MLRGWARVLHNIYLIHLYIKLFGVSPGVYLCLFVHEYCTPVIVWAENQNSQNFCHPIRKSGDARPSHGRSWKLEKSHFWHDDVVVSYMRSFNVASQPMHFSTLFRGHIRIKIFTVFRHFSIFHFRTHSTPSVSFPLVPKSASSKGSLKSFATRRLHLSTRRLHLHTLWPKLVFVWKTCENSHNHSKFSHYLLGEKGRVTTGSCPWPWYWCIFHDIVIFTGRKLFPICVCVVCFSLFRILLLPPQLRTNHFLVLENWSIVGGKCTKKRNAIVVKSMLLQKFFSCQSWGNVEDDQK